MVGRVAWPRSHTQNWEKDGFLREEVKKDNHGRNAGNAVACAAAAFRVAYCATNQATIHFLWSFFIQTDFT